MGVVYKAEDLKLPPLCCAQVPSDDVRKSPQALGRFQREAQAASALNHPNFAQSSIDEYQGQVFHCHGSSWMA